MERLSDPRVSRVVLVGGARYHSLPALPSVANNLSALRALFTAPDLWGLPDANCRTLLDPDTPQEVDAAIRAASAAVRPDGLLLFYFAGHGLIDPRTGALHLAVGQTDPDAVYATTTPYEWVRRAFLDAPTGRLVVILDCCYSGRAIAGMGVPAVADEVEIDLTCVLVAASANRAALAPPREPYTAFTGAVIELLRGGLAGGPELLDLTTVYQQVLATQRRRGRPLPELRARNGGERIPLVHNRAAVRGVAPPREPRPPAPQPETLVGRVLTGTTRLADPDLAAADVAVLAYDHTQGALGVRLGRRLERPPAEVLGRRLADALDPVAVYDGGPVRDAVLLLVALHPDAGCVPGYRPIDGNLGTVPLTTDPDVLARAVRQAWVLVGYVGWRPGQLEAELGQGAFVLSARSVQGWFAVTAEGRT